MTNKYVSWMCDNCRSRNKVSLGDVSKGDRMNPVPIRCPICGVGTAPKYPIIVSSGWLDCMRLTGIAARIPLGPPSANGVVAGDASGPYSIQDYIVKFNVDPWINWCYRHPDTKGCSVVAPVPPPQDLALEAIDKLRKNGVISEEVYSAKRIAIARLKNLKDKKLITEGEYAKDTKTILGKDPKEILGL